MDVYFIAEIFQSTSKPTSCPASGNMRRVSPAATSGKVDFQYAANNQPIVAITSINLESLMSSGNKISILIYCRLLTSTGRRTICCWRPNEVNPIALTQIMYIEDSLHIIKSFCTYIQSGKTSLNSTIRPLSICSSMNVATPRTGLPSALIATFYE